MSEQNRRDGPIEFLQIAAEQFRRRRFLGRDAESEVKQQRVAEKLQSMIQSPYCASPRLRIIQRVIRIPCTIRIISAR